MRKKELFIQYLASMRFGLEPFFAVSVGFNCLGFQYLFLRVRNVKIINVTNAQLKSSKSEVEDSLRLKEVLLGGAS
jgi:hypothetical protein